MTRTSLLPLAVLMLASFARAQGDTASPPTVADAASPAPTKKNDGRMFGLTAQLANSVHALGLDAEVSAMQNNKSAPGLDPAKFAELSQTVFASAAQTKTGDVRFLVESGGKYFSQKVLGGSKWGHPDYQYDDLKRLGVTVNNTADQSEKIVQVLRNTGQPKLSEEQRYDKLQELGKQAFGPAWNADKLDGNPDNDWRPRGGDGPNKDGLRGGYARNPDAAEGGGQDRFDQSRGGSFGKNEKGPNGSPDIIQRFAKFSMAQGLEELISKEHIPLPQDQDGDFGHGSSNGGGTSRPPITPCGLWGGCPSPSTPDESKVTAIDKMLGKDQGGALSAINGGLANGGGADLLAMRSGIMLDQNQFSQAVRDARAALEKDPTNAQAMMVLHSAQGRIDGGGAGGASERGFAGGSAGAGGGATFASAARGGVSLSPSALTVGASRQSGEQAAKEARNALALNDMDSAMSVVNRALAQNPNDPTLLNMRASLYARLGQYAKAIADAKQGLAQTPNNPALLRTLTYSQLRNKDYKDALASANTLIELDPKDAYAYALRGHAFGSLGDRDAMLADVKRAAELDPRFQAALAQVQAPSDSDILFLFPGETAPGAATRTAAAPAGGRVRNFGVVAGAAAFGGLLLAIGLLQTVLAPMKEKVSSVFTRLTRTGPSLAAMPDATPQPASVNGLMPGLIRGQYEITRQIGQGGMGTVYEGTDKSLGRRVAIKKMREELRVNPQERARFVIEAKTVAALHHPNVVDIYAIAEDGQDVFLVFEYVDGRTVHDMVQHAGRLPVADAARIVRASADALGYAHSRGVIHRDMKPSNVMVDGQGRIKVMDFGIARMAKDSATRYSMTNTIVGTPPYMAPEQEQGQVRKESDVYALGICAYEMLTGKLPFIGIGAGMLMNKINMSYVPPSRAIAGLPEALDEVFAKAFQADPDKRYRTPQEFADALESALPSGVRA